MFERFTSLSREVVVGSRAEAEALGHRPVGTEHLLLGLLRAEDGVAAGVLRRAGLDAVKVRDEVRQRVAAGMGREPDAEALRSIGIDLDAVRQHAEQSFGPGALDPTPRRRARGTFGPRAKKVLELSLREALALKHNHIGTEHILLGLLREREGLAARILVERGLRLDDLRAQVLVALQERAA